MHDHKKIIFDTSTLLSVCLYSQREIARIFQAIIQHHTVYTSQDHLDELEAVLKRDKFDPWKAKQERLFFFDTFEKIAIKSDLSVVTTDCRDPKDNHFLSLARSIHADIIISSDKDLLDLHPYHGTQILLAVEAFKVLFNK